MSRSSVQDRYVSDRAPSHYCKTCGEATRERKPYCTDHILDDGYPKTLCEIIAGVDEEIKSVVESGFKKIDVNGLVCEEILAGIATAGQITWRRLVKDHVAFLNNASTETADAYLTRLQIDGLVLTDRSVRGIDVVMLSPKGLRFARKEV